jgi:prepilin-type N-terminal cleavage/methylation domain-containing protein
MEYTKGFTLVELIIVIVIVGILSIVSVPVYKNYVKKAMSTEAKALLGSIITAERIYLAEHGHYRFIEDNDEITNYDKDLGVDARSNKYFTGWGAGGSLEYNVLICGVLGNKGSGADNISMIYITYPSEYANLITQKVGFYEFYEPGGKEDLLGDLLEGD